MLGHKEYKQRYHNISWKMKKKWLENAPFSLGLHPPPTLFKGAGTFIFIEVWLYYIFNQLSTIVVTQMSFTPVRFNRLWKNKKNKWPHNGLQMTLSDPKWPENIIFFFNNSHFGSCNMYSHCFFLRYYVDCTYQIWVWCHQMTSNWPQVIQSDLKTSVFLTVLALGMEHVF